jgi:hypothetical protein
VAPQGIASAALAELTRPKTLAELTELRRRLARAGLRSQERGRPLQHRPRHRR